jgi:hypothetical protein
MHGSYNANAGREQAQTGEQALKPNISAINAHLYAMYPPDFVMAHPEAMVEVIHGPPGIFTNSKWFPAQDLKTIAEFAEDRSAKGDNIYIGASLRHGVIPETGRANAKDNFLAAQNIWAEYDGAGDFERISAVMIANDLEPVALVTTGTIPHIRQHIYVKIKGGIANAQKLENANSGFRNLLDSDNVQDPIRIMRLGGCINYPTAKKRKEKQQVTELIKVAVAPKPRDYAIDVLTGIGNKAADTAADNFSKSASGLGFNCPKSDDELMALLKASRATPGKGWREPMLRFIGSTVGKGWSDLQIKLACAPYSDGGVDDPDIEKIINDTRNNFGKPEIDGTAAAPSDTTNGPVLDRLNAKYFVTKEGGKTWVIAFEKERNRHITTYMKFGDFRNLYMNQLVKIEVKDKPPQFIPLGDRWLRQRRRRQYDGMVFEPGNPATVIDGRFNLWRGWGVVPKRGNWKRMRKHIWLVLAGGDKERFKYIMRWLAWSVQHPDQRAEVALVFKGKRGTGKGTLGNCMMTLFGQHSHQVSNAKHLTGNFNAHMRDLCFLFGDECYWPGQKDAEGTIKRMITEPTLFIEGKGRDAITVPNYLHVMLASNEEWIVPAGENERRYFLNNVSEVKMQNKQWFKAIDDQLKSGGYEAMLFDLMNYKLDNWHPRDLPEINGLLDQQARSLAPLDSWWVELLETGTLMGCDPEGPRDRAVSNKYVATIGNSFGGEREVTRPGLYDQARSIEPRLRNHTSDHQLGTYLKKQGCDNAKKVMRRQGWSFPELLECRAAWEARFPGWKWRDPDITAWRSEEQDHENDDHPDDACSGPKTIF